MKKILATILAAALAGGAWGATTIPVQSKNLFGAIEVTGVASNMYVAVPFEGFDGNPVAASNVIHAAGLAEGTKMYIWNPSSKDYGIYKVQSGKWVATPKVTVSGDDEETPVTYANLAEPVAAGTGAILERKDTSQKVYVYGQIPVSAVAAPTFASGQTLVCVPSTNAMAAVNLNAFTWTGVAATGSKRLKGQATADYIQFRDSANNLVKYFYLPGEGWGVVPTQASRFAAYVAGGKALVPAGTAFWYYRNPAASGSASVSWQQ